MLGAREPPVDPMLNFLQGGLDALYERQTIDPQQPAKPTVTLDTLVEDSKVGDVILFKCNSAQHVLVRAVCYTEFDHVGVVVIDRYGNKLLLESCVIGCCAFDLETPPSSAFTGATTFDDCQAACNGRRASCCNETCI